MINHLTWLVKFLINKMYLSNISIDILELIFNFLDEIDKLNLIKVDKRLIYNFNFGEIKIHINLSNLFIIDNDLSYLTGVHKINLSGCKRITDQGLKYLKRIHTIDLSNCFQLTDQGLQYLKGIHTINLSYCFQLTDQGLQYLFGKSALLPKVS